MRTISLLTVLPALTLIACAGERAPDVSQTADSTAIAPTTSPESRMNLLSNEYAETFTVTLAPGQALPPHPGGARVIYSLSDYTLRFTQDGQTSEQSLTAGQAHFHGAGEHSMENIGATEAKFLVVARTPQSLAPTPEHAEPPAAAGSGPMQRLLTNDDVMVAEFRLPAGAALPRHHGLARVAYSLSEYTISYASNDAAAESKSFVTGEAHWHDADDHTIVNTGNTEARFLLIQFKR